MVLPCQESNALVTTATAILLLTQLLLGVNNVVNANTDADASCRQDYQECNNMIGQSSSSNKTSYSHTRRRGGGDHDNGDNEFFFTWNLNEDSLMNALFSDLTGLQAAWEVHPLLSKVSFSEPQGQGRSVAPLGAIPTIFHNRSALMRYYGHNQHPNENEREGDPLLSLFSVDNSLQVLSHINQFHGSEYKMLKKVVHQTNNGESESSVMGMLPGREYSVDQLTKYFHRDGMSLIVDDMQRRWNSIGKMSRRLEEETRAGEVAVNLYLTPQVSAEEESMRRNGDTRQVLNIHWDMMDVVIVQLSGRKRWSVASKPIVHLSNRDMKRNPTKEELEQYASPNNRFLDFTLCPGDVLYIPRGHMHNASTVVFDDMKRKWADWDACPSYPEGVAAAESLAGPAEMNMPSLHLTFGWYGDFTMEALLQYAVHAYFEEDGKAHQAHNARPKKKNSVVIPAKTCSNPAQSAMEYDVDLKSVLHHSLAEVARRGNTGNCDYYNNSPSHYRGSRVDVLEHPTVEVVEECKTNGVLRQMIPLVLLSEDNELNGLGSLSNSEYDELSDIVEKEKSDVRNLKQSYLKAVDTFGSSASIPRTIDFVQSHILPLGPDDEGMLKFYYPRYRKEKHAILCPHDIGVLLPESDFSEAVDDFAQFARMHFFEALKRMNLDGKRMRDAHRQEQKLNLERVGQGGIL